MLHTFRVQAEVIDRPSQSKVPKRSVCGGFCMAGSMNWGILVCRRPSTKSLTIPGLFWGP